MGQSSRLRRRMGGRSEGKGLKKQHAQQSKRRAAQKPKSTYQEAVEEAEEELFKVEKIIDCRADRNGVLLYKTRWKGYGPGDDTWEPPENVASTGHIDRYERQQRQRALKRTDPGVAVIEYEDGERAMVDMKIEKFRGHVDPSSDDEEIERDDDTVDGDDDVNNFSLVAEGEWIEILWRHTNIYFPCKIISWTPLENKKSQEKRKIGPSRKAISSHLEKSADSGVVPKQKEVFSKHKVTKKNYNRLNQGDDFTSQGQRKRESGLDPSTKNSQLELTKDTDSKPQKSEQKLARIELNQLKRNHKKSKKGDDVAHEGKRKRESDLDTSTRSSRLESARETQPKPAQNSDPKQARMEPTQLKRIYKKSKRGDDVTSQGEKKRGSGLDPSMKNSQREPTRDFQPKPAQKSKTKLSMMETTQLKRNYKKSKQGDDLTNQGKRKRASSLDTSTKNSQLEPAQYTHPKTAQNSQPKLAMMELIHLKRNYKKSKKGDDLTSQGKRKRASSLDMSTKNSQLQPAQGTQPKPAQISESKLEMMEPTQLKRKCKKSRQRDDVINEGKRKRKSGPDPLTKNSQVEPPQQTEPKLAQNSEAWQAMTDSTQLKRNEKTSKQVDDMTNQGKRKREPGLDTSTKNSQLMQVQDTQPKLAQNSKAMLAMTELSRMKQNYNKTKQVDTSQVKRKRESGLDASNKNSQLKPSQETLPKQAQNSQPKLAMMEPIQPKQSYKNSKQRDHVTSQGKRRSESGPETSTKNSQLEPVHDTQQKPAQNPEPTQLKRYYEKSKQGHDVTSQGKRKRESVLDTSTKNPQLEPAQDSRPKTAQNSELELTMMELTQLNRNDRNSEQGNDVTNQGKRKCESGLDTSHKNSQVEPIQDTQPKQAQNSEPKLAMTESTQLKPNYKKSEQENDLTSQGREKLESGIYTSTENSQLERAPVTQPKPAQSSELKLAIMTYTPLKRNYCKLKQGDNVASVGKRKRGSSLDMSTKNSQLKQGKLDTAQDIQPEPAQKSDTRPAMVELTQLNGNHQETKQGYDVTSQGKRKHESGLDTSPDNSQREPAEDTEPKPAQNSKLKLGMMEQTQKTISRWKNEPINQVKVQEEDQNDLDSHCTSSEVSCSESSGISDDASHLDRLVEKVGHGIPLFDEPEDDFSDDDDSDTDEESDVASADEYLSHGEGPKLSFEELWVLKLKRTQEVMDQGHSVKECGS